MKDAPWNVLEEALLLLRKQYNEGRQIKGISPIDVIEALKWVRENKPK